MSKALILIDIQNDYFPGGAMELVGSEAAAQQARKLLDVFRKQSLPVIHLQHVAIRPDATFFIAGTPGAEIHPLVRPEKGETVIEKHLPNSFRETPLLYHLDKADITHLTIAGMMTHMCIDTTVRAAFDRGFQCTLAADACATRDLSMNGTVIPADHVHKAFLASLDGMFARVVPVSEIVDTF